MFSGLNMGVIDIVSGIHLSCYMEIVEPTPTLLISPKFSASRPTTMALQNGEAVFAMVADIKSESGKYLLFMTREQKESGCIINLQPSFPNKAMLNASQGHEIPFLLFILEMPISSKKPMHRSPVNIAAPKIPGHIQDVSFLQIFFVKQKHDMLKVGIA